jgi:hypothetical protein
VFHDCADTSAARVGPAAPSNAGERCPNAFAPTVPPLTPSPRAWPGAGREAVQALNDLTSDGADFAGLDDVRHIIMSLKRMSQEMPGLCEQLARMLVVQCEDGQITPRPGQDPDFWVAEAVEALAAAGQAADMLTAALTQADKTSAELRSSSADR